MPRISRQISRIIFLCVVVLLIVLIVLLFKSKTQQISNTQQNPKHFDLSNPAQVKDVIIPSFQAFSDFGKSKNSSPTGNETAWVSRLNIFCADKDCAPYDFEGANSASGGFMLWKMLALGSVGIWQKRHGLSNDDVTKELREISQRIKADHFNGYIDAFGSHLVNLDYLHENYPTIKELAEFVVIGGDALLFRMDKEFTRRYDGENVMALGMMTRSLARFAKVLARNHQLENINLDMLYNAREFKTPEGRLQLSAKAVEVSDRIIAISNQKLADVPSNKINTDICWHALSEYESALNQKEPVPTAIRSIERLNELAVSRSVDKFPALFDQLQDLAPCIELLVQGCVDLKKDSYCMSAKSAFENAVDFYWDNPANPICNGDGLFIARAGKIDNSGDKPRAACDSATKAIDSSSHMLLLTNRLEELAYKSR